MPNLSDIRYDASEGRIGRIIPARLKPKTDLIDGIEKICRDFGVKNAFVCCSIGSLEKAEFLSIVPKTGTPLKSGYSDPVKIEGPIEFTSGMGIVCKDEKGELVTHFHAVFNDHKFVPHGGHMIKGKNPVIATMDLLIVEVSGVDITRKYDEETGFMSNLVFRRT